MKGTFLSVVAGLLVSSTASSATEGNVDAALADRIARAQVTTAQLLEELAIDRNQSEVGAPSKPTELAQHWHNHFNQHWHNFNQHWHNHH